MKENINQTDRLKLKYNQNTFSLSISSINYDAPDNVTFYWKLEGFYDDWNRLGEEGHLRFTNLASGDYKLYIRAVSKEEPYLYFEERSIDISIARPVWFSFLGHSLLCPADSTDVRCRFPCHGTEKTEKRYPMRKPVSLSIPRMISARH